MIRPARPSDQAYVASTWTMSMLRGERGKAKHAVSRRKIALVVDKALDRKDTRVLIACDPNDENSIRGWLAYAIVDSLTVLLYAFVRKEHRRHGLARELVGSAELSGPPGPFRKVVYTFEGPTTKALKHTVLRGIVRVDPDTLLGKAA